MCQYFNLQALCGGSINIYATEVICPSKLSSSGHGLVGLLFPNEEERRGKKRLAHGIMYTPAKHADLVHDVTDTDCETHNVSTQGRIFATFRCPVLTTRP